MTLHQPPHPHPGVFLVVEGIDGAGKTTQVAKLADALRAAGLDVVTSREPTDGPWGKAIRESAVTGRLSAEDELEHFVRDRREHVDGLIVPALAAGQVVLLDRYYYSTIAYQGERGLDVDWLERHVREGNPLPDRVLFFDLTPEQGRARIVGGRGETPDQFEQAESQERIRAIFHHLLEIDPVMRRIDGGGTVDETHAAVLAELPDRLVERLPPEHRPPRAG
jgi:dTMP kinase